MTETKIDNQIPSNLSPDCLECRLASGFGCILISGYLWVQAKKRKRIEKAAMQVLSTGTFTLGIARLLGFLPKFSTNSIDKK